MSALLLSSAPGNTASIQGVTLQSTSSGKTLDLSAGASSFGESLAASLSQFSASGKPPEKLDMARLSAALEKLGAELEELDPALFQSLRAFLDGQDFSTQGLEMLQAGGNLPDFLASLKQSLENQTGLETLMGAEISGLSELDLSALESSFNELSQLINQQIERKPEDINAAAATAGLPGLAFSLVRDGKAGGSSSTDAVELRWHKYDPQMMSQSSQTAQSPASTQNAQLAQSSQAGTIGAGELPPHSANLNAQAESDKAFNVHLESMKSELPSNLAELADNLADASLEVKDKSGVGKFADLQLRAAVDTAKPYSTTLMTPVDAKEWADEVSQKIVWFTGRNIQAAEMHLNPADLGPIDVKINVQNDVASVSFNVQNASVRELLESNVVRLREMMESNGVNLGDVNVDSGAGDAYREAQNQAGQPGMSGKGMGSTENGSDGLEQEDILEQAVSVRSSNLVDYFV
jgi:flagellar hook-length control protein FliK